ncbi:MAG: 50S ribosomal protein L18 [Acidobacteriota bacterium]|nr:50S ribosomal protein L18 [Acidobacteriota bacterium]MDW3229204.1 50S ribosomal protein L18 [Acidobacteriota bacterium]MDY0231248.1 50S ribosomal protein L18 [Candidatus Saccharicenans sp.]
MLKSKTEVKKLRKQRIRKRISKKLKGTADKPRILVIKSNRYIYTQVIDDISGRVITSASTLEKDFREKAKGLKNKETCSLLGKTLAQRLKEKNISTIVFDRGISPYHGRIKALAESLRAEGISF